MKRKPAPTSKRLRHGKNIDRVKLGIIVLAVLASLIIFGRLVDFAARLGKPFSPDSAKIDKIYKWDGQSVVNVVIKSDSTYVLSFNPVKKTVLNLKIPDETFISVPFSYGFWKMGSVYNLGQSENPGIGANLLKNSLDNMMGIPIYGYLITADSWQKMPLKSIVDKIRRNPIDTLMFLQSSKTDLSFMEFWQVVWGIRGVRSDKISNIDLEKSSLTSGKILADGSRVLESNLPQIDQFIQANFADENVKNEGLAVGIYNATDHPGLAEKAGRIIANLGGRVIFTSNSTRQLEKSLVLGENSYTTAWVSRFFAPNCISKKSACEKNMAGLEYGRADVNIFLGEDYFLRYNKR